MRRIGFVATLVVLGLALACVKPRLQSQMYYDRDLDFSKIKTFAMTGGAGGTPENRALAETGMRKGLEAKPSSQTSPSTPASKPRCR